MDRNIATVATEQVTRTMCKEFLWLWTCLCEPGFVWWNVSTSCFKHPTLHFPTLSLTPERCLFASFLFCTALMFFEVMLFQEYQICEVPQNV